MYSWAGGALLKEEGAFFSLAGSTWQPLDALSRHPCPFSMGSGPWAWGCPGWRVGLAAVADVLFLADTPDNRGAAVAVHHTAARVSMATAAAQGLRGGLHPDPRHGG